MSDTESLGHQETLRIRLSVLVTELVSKGISLEQARREFEREFIVAALKCNSGNLGRSARTLGVHRNTLRNKLSALGIENRDYLDARRPRLSTD